MCPPEVSPGPYKPFKRIIGFVDGGYLRETCKKLYNHDKIDFLKLQKKFVYWFNVRVSTKYPFQADLIRVYYYDAIVNPEHQDYKTQRKYFSDIEKEMLYVVRLGELVKSSKKRFKQKGVDILITIDALTMAYQDHYDIGMFVMGDRDFHPLINAIKNSGKRAVGIYYQPNASLELRKSFDIRINFKKESIKNLLKE